jgi:hypothetical protein
VNKTYRKNVQVRIYSAESMEIEVPDKIRSQDFLLEAIVPVQPIRIPCANKLPIVFIRPKYIRPSRVPSTPMKVGMERRGLWICGSVVIFPCLVNNPTGAMRRLVAAGKKGRRRDYPGTIVQH